MTEVADRSTQEDDREGLEAARLTRPKSATTQRRSPPLLASARMFSRGNVPTDRSLVVRVPEGGARRTQDDNGERVTVWTACSVWACPGSVDTYPSGTLPQEGVRWLRPDARSRPSSRPRPCGSPGPPA